MNVRKAKLIPSYELCIKVRWEGTTAEGQPGSGLIELPYVADENHDEDPEIRCEGSVRCGVCEVWGVRCGVRGLRCGAACRAGRCDTRAGMLCSNARNRLHGPKRAAEGQGELWQRAPVPSAAAAAAAATAAATVVVWAVARFHQLCVAGTAAPMWSVDSNMLMLCVCCVP